MHEELKATLQTLGWVILPPDRWKDHGTDWTAVKPTKGLPECQCNNRSPQLFLKPWCIEMHGGQHGSIAVSICGESPKGILMDLKAYSLKTIEDVELACPQLIAAWTAAAQ